MKHVIVVHVISVISSWGFHTKHRDNVSCTKSLRHTPVIYWGTYTCSMTLRAYVGAIEMTTQTTLGLSNVFLTARLHAKSTQLSLEQHQKTSCTGFGVGEGFVRNACLSPTSPFFTLRCCLFTKKWPLQHACRKNMHEHLWLTGSPSRLQRYTSITLTDLPIFHAQTAGIHPWEQLEPHQVSAAVWGTCRRRLHHQLSNLEDAVTNAKRDNPNWVLEPVTL